MARKTLSELEKQQKRETILEYALSLFGQKGFDATSMSDVASACSMSTGALYLYFPGKREIFTELFSRALAELERTFDDALKLPVPDVRTRFCLIFYSYMNYYRSSNALYHVLMEGQTSGRLSEERFDELTSRFEAMMKKLEALLIEGVLHGAIKPCDTAKTVSALMGLLNGTLALTDSFGVPLADGVQQDYYAISMDIILNGILA